MSGSLQEDQAIVFLVLARHYCPEWYIRQSPFWIANTPSSSWPLNHYSQTRVLPFYSPDKPGLHLFWTGRLFLLFASIRHGDHSCCHKKKTTEGSTKDRKSTRLNSSHVKISYA